MTSVSVLLLLLRFECCNSVVICVRNLVRCVGPITQLLVLVWSFLMTLVLPWWMASSTIGRLVRCDLCSYLIRLGLLLLGRF